MQAKEIIKKIKESEVFSKLNENQLSAIEGEILAGNDGMTEQVQELMNKERDINKMIDLEKDQLLEEMLSFVENVKKRETARVNLDAKEKRAKELEAIEIEEIEQEIEDIK